MRLKNKVALVTGGGSGMGRSGALLFAQEGAQVMVADYQSTGEETAKEICLKTENKAAFVLGDVSVAAECQQMVRETVEKFGRLDILYNNAGVWLPGDGPAPELEEETWDKIININLKGTYLMCRYSIPEMVRSGGGSIINVSSISAIRAGKDIYDAYAASKGGIISMSKTMASTWGSKKIRVNVICPGSISTPMTAPSYVDWVVEYWKNNVPLGRVGEPDEVAKLALFLASNDASYISGAVMMVDGGYMAR